MKKILIVLGIVAAVIILVLISLVGWFVGVYNGLVASDEQTNAAWADVETQYQRRADLIPNLVETVQGAADFESGTQTAIAELRTAARAAQQQFEQAGSVEEQQQAAREVDAVARRFAGLNINVENYPQLSATQNFAQLQDELAGTENRVAVARTRFNEAIRAYNTQVRTLPTAFVANLAGFDQKDLFEADEGAQNAPEVSFN